MSGVLQKCGERSGGRSYHNCLLAIGRSGISVTSLFCLGIFETGRMSGENCLSQHIIVGECREPALVLCLSYFVQGYRDQCAVPNGLDFLVDIEIRVVFRLRTSLLCCGTLM